jgi:hypothetical protein
MATGTLLMLLGIWILKSRAFFAKVRPDKLAEQILLMLLLYSSIHKGAMRQTGVLHYLRHRDALEAAQPEQARRGGQNL